MKNLLTILTAVVLTTNFSFAKNTNYKLTATNLKYTSSKTLEFNIYLLNTNTEQEELRYSLGQYFFEINPKIANGGNLICSIVASELPDNLRPRNPSVSDNLLRLAVNSISADKENLPVIPNQNPGLLIAKVKLETSAKNFAEGEQLNLKFTDEQSKMKTKIVAFNGKENYEITNSENYISEFGGSDNSGNSTTENTIVIPTEYSLSQNYPNPFNPTTNIKFDIPQLSKVRLSIFDISGREVATLVNESMNAGSYQVTFNGANLASGMYFYKITAGSFSVVKKMVLIK